MNPNPFFTVVIPLYNKRPYIRKAINSILNQTFGNFEIIVVDDGSTDDSSSAVPQEDQRVKLLRQNNSGPGAARNHAIMESRGRYITFLDADDFYYEDKLQRTADLFNKHGNIDWLISAFDSQIGDRITYRSIKRIDGEQIVGDPVIINNSLQTIDPTGIHINGLCMNKNLFLESPVGFYEKIHCFEITDFIIKCALIRPRVLIDPKPTHCVVDVPDSAFKSSVNKTIGARYMSRLFEITATDLASAADNYTQHGMGMSFVHVRGLLNEKKYREARQYLFHDYPYKKKWKWLKFLLLSFAPFFITLNLRGFK